jgi:hypothetical protein
MADLPVISYKDFLRNPVVGILFLCLIAISYLYVDNKTNCLSRGGPEDTIKISSYETR